MLSPFSPLPSPTNFFAVLSLMEPTHMNDPIGFCVRTDEQVFFHVECKETLSCLKESGSDMEAVSQ